MRAVNDKPSKCPLPSRIRNAVRAKRPGPNVRSCSRSTAGASAAVSGRIVSAGSLIAFNIPYQALPLSIWTDFGLLPVAFDGAKD